MTKRLLLLAAATLAAAPLPMAAQGRKFRTGIEVLLTDSVHLIKGKRVGLLTNHSGKLPDGTSTIDALFKAPGVKLAALFGPEHGIRGEAQAGEKVQSGTDAQTGVPVISLYGDQRIPTAEQFKMIDVLVYDIQDVGSRNYTYQWTMAQVAEAAGKAGVPVIIADRPNPVRADKFEGGILDTAYKSLVGLYPVPIRYGFTPAELALWMVGSGKFKAEIKPVPMQGYTRAMWYEDTKLPWINPSPNIRTMNAALLYTGTCLYEGNNLSEGRGTDDPFSQVGASWLTDAGALATKLNAMKIPGVRFDSILRPVEAGFEFGGQTIPMIRITVTDRNAIVPIEPAMRMMQLIKQAHPNDFEWKKGSIQRLSGGTRFWEAVDAGTVDKLLPVIAKESADFKAAASKYFLYK